MPNVPGDATRGALRHSCSARLVSKLQCRDNVAPTITECPSLCASIHSAGTPDSETVRQQRCRKQHFHHCLPAIRGNHSESVCIQRRPTLQNSTHVEDSEKDVREVIRKTRRQSHKTWAGVRSRWLKFANDEQVQPKSAKSWNAQVAAIESIPTLGGCSAARHVGVGDTGGSDLGIEKEGEEPNKLGKEKVCEWVYVGTETRSLRFRIHAFKKRWNLVENG